jgi:type IV fimbrial biogenesis protein FimT
MHKGLTVIELLIGIAIISLTLTMTIPSLTTYIQNNRIRSLADELQASLATTKYEAIKRNSRISLVLSGTGWTIQVPTSTETVATTLLKKAAVNSQQNITIFASSNNISFNSQGRLSAGSDAITADIGPLDKAKCLAQGGTNRCLRLQISPAGQIKLCDPQLPSADPRSC